MSRINEYDSSQIFSIAENWRDQCLIGGQSLLWPGRDVWNLANLERFKACFIDRPDPSPDKKFELKFKEQLGNEGESIAENWRDRSGPCRVWIKIRNPASLAVQRERSEMWSR